MQMKTKRLCNLPPPPLQQKGTKPTKTESERKMVKQKKNANDYI